MITSLAIKPLPPGQYLVPAGLQVYFDVASEGGAAPTCFDPAQKRWQCRRADGDYRRTNALLNRLLEARVDGKRLPEFVWHEGLSFWQFLPSYAWPAFYRAVELIDTVEQIIEETAPQQLRVFPVGDDTEEIWQGVLQAIGRRRNIPLVILPAPNPQRKQGQARLRAWLQGLGFSTYEIQSVYRLILKLAGRLLAGCQRKKAAKAPNGKKLLFAAVTRNWVPLPREGGNYDEQFFPLLPSLRYAGWTDFIGIDCPYTPPWKTLPKLWSRIRANEPGMRWNTFYAYGRQTATYNAAARRVFARQWQTLKGDPEFLQDFQYRGISLMPALKSELKRTFNYILPQCAGMLTTAREIIREENPDAMLLTYEQGPFQRALIIQAAQAGVPTVGLQHGLFFDNHPDYMHRDIAANPVANPAGFAVPAITCVWGPLVKKNLAAVGSYPANAVAVTGNWRYDRWAEAAAAVDLPALRKRLGLVDGKKVVLILSAGQYILDYLARCLEVLGQRQDCVPLIKLHPGVDEPGPVRELLQQLGYPATTLYSGQILEALLAADLVISQYSTAIAEAVLLEKPVVLVNFLRISRPGTYADLDICLSVTRPEDLAGTMDQALGDTRVQRRLAAARTKFIRDFYFKADGRASQRVVATLEKLIADKQKEKHI